MSKSPLPNCVTPANCGCQRHGYTDAYDSCPYADVRVIAEQILGVKVKEPLNDLGPLPDWWEPFPKPPRET